MESKSKKEFDLLLKSGMFLVCYPELTGHWEKDKPQWTKIYKEKLKHYPKIKIH